MGKAIEEMEPTDFGERLVNNIIRDSGTGIGKESGSRSVVLVLPVNTTRNDVIGILESYVESASKNHAEIKLHNKSIEEYADEAIAKAQERYKKHQSGTKAMNSMDRIYPDSIYMSLYVNKVYTEEELADPNTISDPYRKQSLLKDRWYAKQERKYGPRCWS